MDSLTKETDISIIQDVSKTSNVNILEILECRIYKGPSTMNVAQYTQFTDEDIGAQRRLP